MGDYAEGIAKISLMMGDEPPLKPLIDIPRMSEMATDMLRRSLDALVHKDTVAAMGVCHGDDDVDALYDQVYRELIFFMIQDPKTIQRATYLLWVAHDLERVADRATNIAERVIFMVTGKMVEINSSSHWSPSCPARTERSGCGDSPASEFFPGATHSHATEPTARAGKVVCGLERVMGIEPTTTCLGSKSSTTELHPLG